MILELDLKLHCEGCWNVFYKTKEAEPAPKGVKFTSGSLSSCSRKRGNSKFVWWAKQAHLHLVLVTHSTALPPAGVSTCAHCARFSRRAYHSMSTISTSAGVTVCISYFSMVEVIHNFSLFYFIYILHVYPFKKKNHTIILKPLEGDIDMHTACIFPTSHRSVWLWYKICLLITYWSAYFICVVIKTPYLQS